MIRRNIISGLLLFCLAILIGPYMMEAGSGASTRALGDIRAGFDSLSAASEAYDAAAAAGTVTEAETGALADAAAEVLGAHVRYSFAEIRMGHFRFSHAHGNLEGVLNILVGLFLGFVAIGARARLALSWGFIAGSWGHAGFFILGNFWLPQILAYAKYGGVILILSLFGLLVAVAWKGIIPSRT